MFSLLIKYWIGTQQLILIIIIALVLFGGKKIPELMKGLGSGIKEFKKATNENENDNNNKNETENN